MVSICCDITIFVEASLSVLSLTLRVPLWSWGWDGDSEVDGWYMLIYVDIVGEGMIRYEADVFWFIFRASGSRGGHRELAKRLVGQAGWVSFADHGRFSPKWWPLWPFKNSETCWKLMIYYRTFLPQHVQVPNLRRKKVKDDFGNPGGFPKYLVIEMNKTMNKHGF